jgi:hypothetical protein
VSFLHVLGFAALGMLVPLVVLYLLKQKRQETQVPAAFLWQHALEDLRASSLFQRLRTPLLFFLQVASVILFGLAAAGASLDVSAGDEPRRVILVVDRSRSMQAEDEDGRTRMEVARDLCRDAIDGLRGSDELMLVAFDARATVLVAFTGDEDLLTDAVDSLESRDLPSRPAEALRLAGSFAKASPGFVPEVLVVSDGAVTGDLPLLSCEVTFARIGTSGDNQGVADARLTHVPGELPQLFVRVENGAPEPASRMLVLRRDGEVADARKLVIPPGGDAVAFFELEEPEGEAPVILEAGLDGEDVLDADDRVRLILRPSVPRFGLLVRDTPSLHLDARKLEALHPGLAVVEVTRAEALASIDGGTRVDLVVYDGVAPDAIPEVPAQIYVGALPPGSGLSSSGSQELPIIIDWSHTHPVTARCKLGDVHIDESLRLAGHERSEVLVDTTGGPLLLLTPVPGREVLLLGMNPSQSNLPLKLAWPLFLANSLDFLLADVQREDEAPLFPTGTPIRVDGAESFDVVLPDGTRVTSEPAPDGRPIVATTHAAGLYEVEGKDADVRSFALLDSDEIRVAPAEELVLGGDRVKASPGGIRRNLLLRDPLLLLALAILLLEWAVWCGRR